MGARAAMRLVAGEAVRDASREDVGLPGLLDQVPAVEAGDVDQDKRGRGPNKADRELAEWLLRLGYRDPMIALHEVGGGGSLEELVLRARWMASQLGAKPFDCFKLILESAKEAARFWHAAKTPEKGADSGPGVVIVYAGGDVSVGAVGQAVVFAETQENQGFIDGTARELDAPQSDTSQNS